MAKLIYRYPGQKMIYGNTAESPVYLKEFYRINRTLAVNSMIKGSISSSANTSSILENIKTVNLLISSIYKKTIQSTASVSSIFRRKHSNIINVSSITNYVTSSVLINSTIISRKISSNVDLHSISKQLVKNATDISSIKEQTQINLTSVSSIYSKTAVSNLTNSTIYNKLQTNLITVSVHLIQKVQSNLVISTQLQNKAANSLITSSIGNKYISPVLQTSAWKPYSGYSAIAVMAVHENQQKMSVDGKNANYIGSINIRKPSSNNYLHTKTSKTIAASDGQYDGTHWDISQLSKSKGLILKAVTQKDKDKIVNMLNNPNSSLYMLKSAGKPVVVVYDNKVHAY